MLRSRELLAGIPANDDDGRMDCFKLAAATVITLKLIGLEKAACPHRENLEAEGIKDWGRRLCGRPDQTLVCFRSIVAWTEPQCKWIELQSECGTEERVEMARQSCVRKILPAASLRLPTMLRGGRDCCSTRHSTNRSEAGCNMLAVLPVYLS